MTKYNIGDYLGDGKHKFIKRNGRKGKFICGYCGKEFEGYISSVALNQKKSCGCLHDLVGKKIGRLTVLKKTNEQNNQRAWYWLCKCDCGQLTKVSTGNLQSGRVQSCGCSVGEKQLKKSHNKMLNKRFNKLTVLEDTGKRNCNGTIIWKCQCDCGNIVEVPTNHLNNGHTSSCGCLTSKCEEEISKYLRELNIKYYRQKTFDDCRNPKTNALLKFDFYLPELNMCIEYDGKQHFAVSGGWSTSEHLKETQYRDKIKEQYCQDNNIKLIRISYLQKDNLNSILYDLISRSLKEELNDRR